MAPSRNGWIDVLRALGAMAVALFHLNVIQQPVPTGALAHRWHVLWQHGHLGVAVFFALSGYCLMPGWCRSPGWPDFLQRRIGRILPPYWCSLLLVAGLAGALKAVTGTNDIAGLPRTPGAILATLCLLTDPVTAVPRSNWVYWTLSCMLAFYLLTGLTLLAGRRRVAWLAGLHAGLCAVDVIFHPAPAGGLFFIRHWPVFAVGAALGLWPAHRRAAQAMLAVSILHASWTIGTGADETHYVLVGGLTAVALVLTHRRPLPRLLEPLAPLGRISYSLYLVHIPVGIYLLARFLPGEYSHAATFIGWQLLWLAGTLAAAAGFYLLGERPFLPIGPRPASV